MAGASGVDFLANDGIEFLSRDKLFDGQLADGDDEPGLKNLDFALEPFGAILHFFRRRDAVTARGFFAGKTAADSGHVNGGAEGFLGHPGGIVEPPEKRLAGGPGEGTAEHGFLVAGRLADEEDPADHRPAADDGRPHLRAQAARQQTADVCGEELAHFLDVIVRGQGFNKTGFHRLRKKIKL